MARRKKAAIEGDEVKGDMTPMIDIIFLLLIFFILTTKFIPSEKAISSILPTDKGQAASKPQEIEPPKEINIKVFPANMNRGMQPSRYDALWKTDLDPIAKKQDVWLQIGNADPIVLDGRKLNPSKQFNASVANQDGETDKIHGFIYRELEKRELSGTERKKQDIITIHCFSGLPWKYALLVYDAVRVYETDKSDKAIDMNDPLSVAEAREVNFAPPRIRDYHTWELGNELFEIVHKK